MPAAAQDVAVADGEFRRAPRAGAVDAAGLQRAP